MNNIIPKTIIDLTDAFMDRLPPLHIWDDPNEIHC